MHSHECTSNTATDTKLPLKCSKISGQICKVVCIFHWLKTGFVTLCQSFVQNQLLIIVNWPVIDASCTNCFVHCTALLIRVQLIQTSCWHMFSCWEREKNSHTFPFVFCPLRTVQLEWLELCCYLVPLVDAANHWLGLHARPTLIKVHILHSISKKVFKYTASMGIFPSFV